jgi:Zn finger protein HypA/HybF involved in hydrogenase expression
MTLKCKKCGYQWFPRMENPTVCPKCKSYKWNSDTDGRRNNLNLADEYPFGIDHSLEGD